MTPVLFCNFAEIEPVNPNCTVGEPMNITCILNLSQKEIQYDIHDVYFTIDDKPVDSSLTHIDGNRLILRSIATEEMDHTYVRCFLKNTRIDSALMLAGCKYRIQNHNSNLKRLLFLDD